MAKRKDIDGKEKFDTCWVAIVDILYTEQVLSDHVMAIRKLFVCTYQIKINWLKSFWPRFYIVVLGIAFFFF